MNKGGHSVNKLKEWRVLILFAGVAGMLGLGYAGYHAVDYYTYGERLAANETDTYINKEDYQDIDELAQNAPMRLILTQFDEGYIYPTQNLIESSQQQIRYIERMVKDLEKLAGHTQENELTGAISGRIGELEQAVEILTTNQAELKEIVEKIEQQKSEASKSDVEKINKLLAESDEAIVEALAGTYKGEDELIRLVMQSHLIHNLTDDEFKEYTGYLRTRIQRAHQTAQELIDVARYNLDSEDAGQFIEETAQGYYETAIPLIEEWELDAKYRGGLMDYLTNSQERKFERFKTLETE